MIPFFGSNGNRKVFLNHIVRLESLFQTKQESDRQTPAQYQKAYMDFLI